MQLPLIEVRQWGCPSSRGVQQRWGLDVPGPGAVPRPGCRHGRYTGAVYCEVNDDIISAFCILIEICVLNYLLK